MPKCPDCGGQIDHLNHYALRPVMMILEPDGEQSDERVNGSLENDFYGCPACGEAVATTHEEAMQILTGG